MCRLELLTDHDRMDAMSAIETTKVSRTAAMASRAAASSMAWQHQPCPYATKAIRVRVNGDFLTTGRPKEPLSP